MKQVRKMWGLPVKTI